MCQDVQLLTSHLRTARIEHMSNGLQQKEKLFSKPSSSAEIPLSCSTEVRGGHTLGTLFSKIETHGSSHPTSLESHQEDQWQKVRKVVSNLHLFAHWKYVHMPWPLFHLHPTSFNPLEQWHQQFIPLSSLPGASASLLSSRKYTQLLTSHWSSYEASQNVSCPKKFSRILLWSHSLDQLLSPKLWVPSSLLINLVLQPMLLFHHSNQPRIQTLPSSLDYQPPSRFAALLLLFTPLYNL